MICYINGKYKIKEQVFLQASDIGFTRAYTAYECFKTYNLKPFFLKDHITRLKNTCNSLLLNYPKENLEEIIESLIKKNPNKEIIFYIYITGGVENKQSLIILTEQFKQIPQNEYEKGYKIQTINFVRNLNNIKSTNYTSSILFLKQANLEGYDEVLFMDEKNNLLELSKANFFGIKNNKLYTTEKNILKGITRKYVLQLAKEIGLGIIQNDIPYKMIKEFDEAFLSSSIKEILPISQIDDVKITKREKTNKLHDLFKKNYYFSVYSINK